MISPELLNQASETITTIVAFVIFFWVMKKYAWGPLTVVLDERQRRISQGFEEIKLKQAAAGDLERALERFLMSKRCRFAASDSAPSTNSAEKTGVEMEALTAVAVLALSAPSR
jgi:hypothetical protein